MSLRTAFGEATAPYGWWAERVVTCDSARATAGNPLGVIEDGAVVIGVDKRVAYVGPKANAPAGVKLQHAGQVITPGLVDAHTHAAWMGSRHGEYVVRMAGGDYRAIAEAGGGILASHRAIVAASEKEIGDALEARLLRMAALGVTCVEVKSGYGLEPDEEAKQLTAIDSVAKRGLCPAIVPTFLALHALPLRARESAKARTMYISHVAEVLIPRAAEAKLARFVDAYVDDGAFTTEEARLVGEAAIKAGLGVRLHVGQFKDIGGAELAASLKARSVDHVEHISAGAVTELARANVSAVLLPVASFTLAQTPPPVAELRDAGVKLVVASDANPGTAPNESLPLAMAFAVRLYGMTPDEVLLAATRNAALSLDEADRGHLTVGAHGDLVAWDLPHEHAIVQPWGVSRTRLVVSEGATLHASLG